MEMPAVDSLLRWYRAEGRDLPWRRDPTPYKVLLSEFLCQQTRVETALPYFERFVARWPSIDALAAAGEDALVEAWAGLGYYSRARNLHRCAVAAVAQGGIPSTADALQALPGVGPYTAGAIASIAFAERVPAIDGNLQRVLSRLFAVDEVPSSPAGKRRLAALGQALHDSAPPEAHPGDLNQSLMELGARICTPKNPACTACPLSSACMALRSGRVAELPRPKPRKKPRPIRGVAGVLASADGILLVKRAGRGLLGGLWTPPLVLDLDEQPAEVALIDAFARAGVPVRPTRRLGEVVHVFSHRRLTAEVFAVTPTASVAPQAGEGWSDVRYAAVGEGRSKGLSTLARKILSVALDPDPAASQLSLLAADGEGT
jgi:A/G-specific adenine glycosylase